MAFTHASAYTIVARSLGSTRVASSPAWRPPAGSDDAPLVLRPRAHGLSK